MATTEILDAATCWELLAGSSVGRIGFDVGRGPRIHPVNYRVDGETVLLRTATHSELALFDQLFSDGSRVAFEVDDIDLEGHEGWSVLLAGQLSRVSENEWGIGPHRLAPRPWVDVARASLLRITPVEVTGRRLRQLPPARPLSDRERAPGRSA